MKPNSAITYGNATAKMIASLEAVIERAKENHPILTGIRVGSKRLSPQQSNKPEKEVIVIPTGSIDLDDQVSREQGFYVHIYVNTNDNAYVVAERLSTVVEGCLASIRGGYGISSVGIDMSAVDATDVNGEEHRVINATALITGETFTL